MRTLLVAHEAPWPSHGGALMRTAKVAEVIASMSELDVFAFQDARQSRFVVPQDVPVHRTMSMRHPHDSSQLRWRLEWALHRGLPIEVVRVKADSTPRRTLAEWNRAPYDVVWFSTPAVYEWTGRPHLGPTVVDLMDLEHLKARLWATLRSRQMHSGGLGQATRMRLASYQARLNSRDWSRFQRAVAGQVERIVVASELDAARSGLENVTVIPNTYPRPLRPAGCPDVVAKPVLLFQGSLEYAPNVDAAEWLASDIAPRIRNAVPATEVRLVGQPTARVRGLHKPPEVTVVGRVASMEQELATATVAVVPIRFGGGTRIKILESFAHRVPVVSTTTGAEGLDVEDGVHLVLADDPEKFAAATVRLLREPELRVRLADAAEELHRQRFDDPVAEAGIRRLVHDMAQ